MNIRHAEVSDAKSLLELFKQIDTETNFMLLEPDERTTTIEDQKKIIQDFAKSDTKAMIVAEENGDLLGFIIGVGNTTRRNRHSLYCVIGLIQSATGQGLGHQLLTNLEKWATLHGITRLELTVLCHNTRAIRLYKNFGFEVEGTKRHSLKIDGEYFDEFLMSKLLV
ncbi:GNAT family N-acetyltransferase [Psychrobacter sanguinis]|uniref:GNAT family N-acetyltransferase n=1 Tax=Psychrobacter sanguinis TaxID=861445 RepID=UPI001917EF95|nr:GNAT family N-acetyltransferase [Psychrobacter sanguinis]MCC3346010.1 GNAT family N-acetyltransferase [Psychrobacter sanguinis]